METTLYGWSLMAIPVPGTLLDSDGKPTQFMPARVFTHQPGDVVNSRDGKSRYMVHSDRSLRKI